MADTTKTLREAAERLVRSKMLTQAGEVNGDNPELDAAERFFRAAIDAIDAIDARKQSTEASDPLNVIGAALRIGKDARTLDVILANIENASRRSACLSAVEREFFTREVPGDDDDLYEECLLNWGHEPDEYVATFRTALAAQAQGEPVEFSRPYGSCAISGPREDVEFIFRHLPDVDDPKPAAQPVQTDLDLMRQALDAIVASGLSGTKTKQARVAAAAALSARLAEPVQPVAVPASSVTLHECVGCGHLYQDVVSQCDCLKNDENVYREWIAAPAAEPTVQPVAVPEGMAEDAARWRYAMDWGTTGFAVCKRVGRTGACWEPIKTNGPIDRAMLAAAAPAAPAAPAQAQGEPYGWAVTGGLRLYFGEFAEHEAKEWARIFGGTAEAFPLYRHTEQPVRQPLTDERIRDIVREAGRGSALLRDGNTSLRIARATERECAALWGVTLGGIGQEGAQQ